MKRFLAVIAAVLSCAAQVNAQILYGSLIGNVTDSTNAVIPSAEVRVTHVDTNQSRTSVTNDAGGYTFANLAPGTYEVIGFEDRIPAGEEIRGDRLHQYRFARRASCWKWAQSPKR